MLAALMNRQKTKQADFMTVTFSSYELGEKTGPGNSYQKKSRISIFAGICVPGKCRSSRRFVIRVTVSGGRDSGDAGRCQSRRYMERRA